MMIIFYILYHIIKEMLWINDQYSWNAVTNLKPNDQSLTEILFFDKIVKNKSEQIIIAINSKMKFEYTFSNVSRKYISHSYSFPANIK